VAFLPYSYTGGAMDGSDTWRPNPYGCQDTFTHSLNDDVARVHRLMTDYLARYPNTDFYLIGHSQGGLIAFSYLVYLRQQTTPGPWTLPRGGRLRGVVTLDSSLGGIPNTVGLALAKLNYDRSGNCPAMIETNPLPYVSLDQMGTIARTIPTGAHPRGAQASVDEAL